MDSKEAGMIQVRVLSTSKPVARDESQGYKPLARYWGKVLGHVTAPPGEGHVVTVVKDKEGAQVYCCCVGSFVVDRDQVADPFLFDVQDPREFLEALLNHLREMAEKEAELNARETQVPGQQDT